MNTPIYFTADHQRLLRELVENNLLDQLLDDASDGEVQIETDVIDTEGGQLIAVFEQNNMPVIATGAETLF